MTNFLVHTEDHVATVSFNRPEKANALDELAWEELHQIFDDLHADDAVRAIILRGEGKHFCAGIDLTTLMSLQRFDQDINCEGRKREAIRRFIVKLQAAITAIEQCRKPVLAAIHGACVGGGLDIAAACDMRYCTADAYFSIKEIDLGLVADLGSLQRLPKIIAPGMVAEMAYTARRVGGQEATTIGLTNHTYPDAEALLQGVQALAASIAEKSPICVRGIKENLLYSRDHAVPESLHYMATWNAAMLMSTDIKEAFMATVEKRKAVFED